MMTENDKKCYFDFNSILFAFYLSIPMFSKFFTWLFPLSDNANIILIFFITVIFIIFNRKTIRVTKPFLIVNFFILLLFLISFIMVSDRTYTLFYFLNYFLYCFLGMLFVQYDYKYENVLKWISIIFILFTITLYFKYFPIIKTSIYLSFTMELSYSALIGYIAAVIYNFKYNKTVIFKIIIYGCLLLNTYYLIFLNDNRGSLIALFLFFIIYFLKNMKKLKYRIIVFIISTLICIFSINFALDYISKMDTNINWILRLQYQMKINNISSDRDIVYKKALNHIENNYVLGNGIGEFENDNSGVYVHNLFLQIACENGILFAVLFSLFLLKCFCKTIFGDIRSDRDLFLLFAFSQFIPRLLLSSVQWVNSFFWIYIYLFLKDSFDRIKLKYNK